MANCTSCGQRENPKEAPIVGPAVILGNGAVRPFADDAALDRYIEWAARRRAGERFTILREGESA